MGKKLSVLLLIAGLGGTSASALQDDGKEELGEIGMALKAAVRAGAMTPEDGKAVWGSLVAEYEESDIYAGQDQAKEDSKSVQSIRIGSIPLRLRALLQPEFTRRDLSLFRDAMGLEREQLAVIENLLEDYIELFEMASQPMREAMGRYRRAQRDVRIARILEESNLGDVSSTVAQAMRQYAQERTAKMEGAGSKMSRRDREQESREIRDYSSKLMGAMETMETRLEELRGNVQERLADVAVTGDVVTSDDLIRLAEVLESERIRLRDEFINYLALIANVDRNEAERMRFDSALGRVLIEHELAGGWLAGEAINLRALAATDLSMADQALLENIIEERQSVLAQAMKNRVEARINRELIGLNLLRAYDRAIQNGVSSQDALTENDVKPYVRAYLAELQASVIVRDELLDQLGTSYSALDAQNPDQAMAYREMGLRQGFREEMRELWAERALDVAFTLEGLEEETLATLVEIIDFVDADLEMIRTEAIAERITNEPKMYRSWMEGMGSPDGGKSDETWAKEKEAGEAREELNTQIDDRTEQQLMSLLTPEQFEQLPPRRKQYDEYGKGKGGGDKSATAKGGKGAQGGKGGKGGQGGKGAQGDQGGNGKGSGRSTGRSRAGQKD